MQNQLICFCHMELQSLVGEPHSSCMRNSIRSVALFACLHQRLGDMSSFQRAVMSRERLAWTPDIKEKVYVQYRRFQVRVCELQCTKSGFPSPVSGGFSMKVRCIHYHVQHVQAFNWMIMLNGFFKSVQQMPFTLLLNDSPMRHASQVKEFTVYIILMCGQWQTPCNMKAQRQFSVNV